MHIKLTKIILLLILLPFFSAFTRRDTDSLIKLLNSADGKNKAELYLKIGNSFKDYNIDSLVHYDSLALMQSRLTGNIRLEAESLYEIGFNLYLLGDNQRSLELSEQALTSYKFLNDKNGTAKSLNTIGIIYQNFGDYEKALISQLNALDNYEEARNYYGVALTYNHLGVFYKNLNEYSKSGDYYNKALKILDEYPDRGLLARIYNNIGNLYLRKGDLKNALKYNLESLKIKKIINAGPAAMVNSYLSIGTVLREMKQYGASAVEYKLGINIAYKIGNKNHQAILLKNLGILYGLMGWYQESLQYYDRGIKLAREINFNRTILDDLQGLSQIYKKLENYKRSLTYFKKYRQVKDSIFNKNLNIKLEKYRNQYEIEKRAKEIQQLKAGRQKTASISLILAFILIILLLIVILNRYRTKTKTNRELLNKNNEVAGLFNKLNDLNKNLTDSESTYRYLFESNPIAMFILNEETLKILAANKSAVEQYGFAESELTGFTFENLWDPENKGSYLDFKKYILNSSGKIISVSHCRKDGNIISVEIAGSHLIFEGKNSLYVMVSDETERKLIEQVVHESEERFRILFEGAPDAIIIVDTYGNNILASNPAASKLFQRPADQLSKLSHWALYAQDKKTAVKESFAGLLSLDNSELTIPAVEFEIVRPDGIKIPVEISRKVMTISDSPVIQCIFREITLRKTAEEALKQGEQRLRRAQKIANVGSWELNLKTRLLEGCEELSLVLGFEKDITSIPIDELIALTYREDRETIITGIKSLIKNSSEFDIKFKIKKKDNDETRILEVQAELIKDENNRPQKILGAVRDITELNNNQEQLILARENAERSDKLKSDFLAQMSHEIRSPVNIIMNYASLIKDELNNEASEDIKSCFASIDKGGKRLIRTIDLILNMADVQSGKYEAYMEHTDLEKDILKNLISEYTPAANKMGLKITFINEPQLKKILIDRYTVTQIFSNLIDNAVKYTKAGEIVVKISGLKNHIAVVVSDTGIGISNEFLPHIFDPFSQEDHGYTRRFEGTGLGLSLVKKYCDLNGAEIQVESKKGTGTVFTVIFKAETENQMLATFSNM